MRATAATTLAVLLSGPHRAPTGVLLSGPQRAPVPRLQQTSSSPTLSVPPPWELLQKLASSEALELQQELVGLAMEQDPEVVLRRSFDLARAVNTVSFETVQGAAAGDVSEPAIILRRLCEELGATYVKLGQFIASSPTLFPPEYVSEFQK